MRKSFHYLPIAIIVSCMIAFYFSGAFSFVTFGNLKEYRVELLDYVDSNFVLASMIYIFAYIIIGALSIPVAMYMSLLGGFLFPQPFSLVFVVIGATLGASIIFIATKTAFREPFRRKAGSFLKKMEDGFHENATHYLLFLRLVPIFPFWGINITAACFGVRFWTFFWTTAIGMVPVSFVFTQAGAGLGAIFDQNVEFEMRDLLNRDLLFALGGLLLLISFVFSYKKIKTTPRPDF